jgi:hypothetical protein
MRMHLGRTSVVISAAVMLALAAANINAARAVPLTTNATNIHSGTPNTLLDGFLRPPSK